MARAPLVPDAHLFDLAMRDVAPLKRRRARAKAAAPAVVPRPAAIALPVARPAPVAYAPAPLPPRPSVRAAPEPGLDRNTAKRFARGEMPIDSAIDLHGMTQMRAHEALDRFVAAALKGGARVLLVVTGKGRQGEGILRRHVPEWLKAGPYASRILRLSSARPPHGGEGAFYVLLRRAR